VVRLLGNHELLLLQGIFDYAKYQDREGMGAELESEVLSGRLLAAYSDGRRLYTHAGLREEVKRRLLGGKGGRVPSPVELAGIINRRFAGMVKRGALEVDGHPLLWIDSERGGWRDTGGIFWGDWSLLRSPLRAGFIPQVVGHSPTANRRMETAAGGLLVNVDTGICRYYKGRLSYLEIGPDGRATCHIKDKRAGWSSVLLAE
jgi:hypothetical protein